VHAAKVKNKYGCTVAKLPICGENAHKFMLKARVWVQIDLLQRLTPRLPSLWHDGVRDTDISGASISQ
jgi:hypothetical protein